MKTLGNFSLIIVATLLAGCGARDTFFQTPSFASNDRMAHQAARSYQVLYHFRALSSGDGFYPSAPLIEANGMFYGTTYYGGSSNNGTVYSISPTGAETVLHSFSGGADGAKPLAGLVYVNGTLYGTTYRGGSLSVGTVYSITTSGSEEVIHSFKGGSDGSFPRSELIDVNGTLYGTTVFGGSSRCSGLYPGCGVVYSITTAGSERILHKFVGGSDGELPFAGLTDVNGVLYGTTAFGGSGGCGGDPCGTVFRITRAGAEKVVHSFGPDGDGTYPHTGLLYAHGMLYGTTLFGGMRSGCQGGSGYGEGCGVVYSLSTAGKVKVLHSFNGGKSDGAAPSGELVDVKGTLYGTTSGGGPDRSGTVYSVNSSGTEIVIHAFARHIGGAHPAAGLIYVNSKLFGTASDHGHKGCSPFDKGCGTVFSLTLPR